MLAATNKDLPAAIKAGAFREDLYYRLNAVTIRLPALREIRDDIPLLAASLLAKHCRDSQRAPPDLPIETQAVLRNYAWPGNVRQLDNEMRRLAVTVRTGRVEISDLSESIRGCDRAVAPKPQAMKDAIEDLERRLIAAALEANKHNQLKTAKALGMSRQGLIKKLRRYGLAR
jgi:DNA-binding NtrC family response regulator